MTCSARGRPFQAGVDSDQKSGLGSNGLTLDPVHGLAEFRRSDPDATDTTVNGRKALTRDLAARVEPLLPK